MADRKMAPGEKRVLVRFLTRCGKPEAEEGTATDDAVDDGPPLAGTFADLLEQEFRLPARLRGLVTDTMTWSPPDESAVRPPCVKRES